ncbi:MAG: DUF3501 family protein [Acidimicrobiia bacterium]|nr:DUF3501 family protein [Acidimicrobiia bacterium]
MQKLVITDIKDHREYERERDEFRSSVIALKKRRRFGLGEFMTIVFENTATMRFQIQEMARAEKMIRDEQIAHEVATYNDLIPNAGELSATFFIEINNEEKLREWLPKLVGIENCVSVWVDDSEVRAEEEDSERLTREDITSAVHYLRFSFTSAQQAAFATSAIKIVIDHPQYQASLMLSDEQRSEIASDFSD